MDLKDIGTAVHEFFTVKQTITHGPADGPKTVEKIPETPAGITTKVGLVGLATGVGLWLFRKIQGWFSRTTEPESTMEKTTLK